LTRVQFFHEGESNPNYHMTEAYKLLGHKSLFIGLVQWYTHLDQSSLVCPLLDILTKPAWYAHCWFWC